MAAKKTKILITDDVPVMRKLLIGVLRDLDYVNIAEASNGEDALSMYAREKFDISFLDIDMPGEDGLKVLAQMKQIRPETHVVMVSAHSSVNNVTSALSAGAAGFVVKPFSAQKIVDVLKKCR